MLFIYKKVCISQKTLNVLQIKEIHFSSIDLDRVFCQFIAKSISNDATLTLSECKITKGGCKAFSVEIGDKQVTKDRKMFKKPFLSNNYVI